MGIFEVTNFQYELFDPTHKLLRGRGGISTDDNEPVIYVNWYNAQAFCEWLSEKEGLPYRLPTEAEWEYACRAGTTTNYYSGDTLAEEYQKNQHETRLAEPVSLRVGQTPANAWGLYDMLGNVEEWCYDWYGYYQPGRCVDPVGYSDGQFRVTRGGSHGTQVYELRSANRMAALPETKNWITGFRVVLGRLPDTRPLPAPPVPLNQRDVVDRPRSEITKGPDPEKPYFKGPRKFVKIHRGSNGPLFAAHNHDPAIVECPNGDLLACWYTCESERNRELGQAASRLRWGADEWEPASEFWDVPGRNDHAPAMWFDGKDTIYHISGLSFAGEHSAMAVILRTSKDSGRTWSRARFALPSFEGGHMPVEAFLRLQDGSIVFTSDGSPTLWASRDEGLTWTSCEGAIKGTHPAVAQLKDGRLLGFTRGMRVQAKMPVVTSEDMGKTWNYAPSEFPAIGGGQRLVLLRLKEGPLFFASFADEGITITDQSGKQRKVQGLFGAVSLDEGKTWLFKRLISDDGPGRAVECTNGGLFIMSGRHAEYRGYLSVCQSLDGVINLISSREHYAFNLKWLMTPPPPLSYPPVKLKEAVETFTGPRDFDCDGWVDYKTYTGGFNGRGQYTINSTSRADGLNRIVGKGSFEMTVAVDNLKFNPADGRTLPGFYIRFKDGYKQVLALSVEQDHISFFKDRISYAQPPKSAKVKVIWNEAARQWRVFYGLNGAEPTIELPQSKAGLHIEQPLSESTTVYLLYEQGSMDLDYFEIKSLR